MEPFPAWHPNHLWSNYLTEVFYWGLWKIYILVAIDHFYRKVLAVTPLEGPNAGRMVPFFFIVPLTF
jgi:hypothetical protein